MVIKLIFLCKSCQCYLVTIASIIGMYVGKMTSSMENLAIHVPDINGNFFKEL